MPYRTIWIAPKKFLRHKGVTIWHTYGDNEESSGESRHYFTTAGDHNEEEHSFDVRQLSTWTEPAHPPYLSDLKGRARAAADRQWREYADDRTEEKHIKAAIKASIEKMELKNETD